MWNDFFHLAGQGCSKGLSDLSLCGFKPAGLFELKSPWISILPHQKTVVLLKKLSQIRYVGAVVREWSTLSTRVESWNFPFTSKHNKHFVQCSICVTCQYLYAAPAEGIILLQNKYITPYFLSYKPCEGKKKPWTVSSKRQSEINTLRKSNKSFR